MMRLMFGSGVQDRVGIEKAAGWEDDEERAAKYRFEAVHICLRDSAGR